MLTPAWEKLRPHKLQSMLWRTHARFVAAACGRGSGKTEIARRRVIRMLPIKKPWTDPKYFYGLPTYKQAKRIAWRPLVDLIPPDWIKKINESEMRIETVFGSSLYVVGLDKPQRIEGDQWDGGVLDESSDQKPGTFTRSVLPALSHRDGWCWRIGVPKRFGVGAAEFKKFFKEGYEPGTPGAEHESYTWPSWDILSEEKLRWARENLDPKDYNEQYGASWETISGLIFYGFDEVMNVSNTISYDPAKPLIVGSDFNVDPMAWVVCQESTDKKQLWVLDEIWKRNTNTRETLDHLYARYGTHQAGFHFYGDASSRARNTRASESDFLQIKNDQRFQRAKVFYPKRNPVVANRFATCNALFLNAAGERRCIVHPRCTNLIEDLGSRAYKPGTNEVDDHGDIGHITDALGYVIYIKFPLKYNLTSAPEVYIDG